MGYISATHIRDQVVVWERDPNQKRVIKQYNAPYYFYINDDEFGTHKTIYGNRVSKVEFQTNNQYRAAKKKYASQQIMTWESDINPEIRVLSKHYYGSRVPKLHVTLLDIEIDLGANDYPIDHKVTIIIDQQTKIVTVGEARRLILTNNITVLDPETKLWVEGKKSSIHTNPDFSIPVSEVVASRPFYPINSVALYHRWKSQYVLLTIPPEVGWTEENLREQLNLCAPNAPLPKDVNLEIIICNDETELLLNLLNEIEDSDVLSGWNSDLFDVTYIAQRISRVLDKNNIDLATVNSFNDAGKQTLVYKDNVNVEINGEPGRFKFLRKLDFPKYGKIQFRPVANPKTGDLMGNCVDLTGRVSLDMMNLVKKYEPGERSSYKLATISQEILVDDVTGEPTLPKLEYQGSLADLYRTDYPFFCRYNIRDTEILNGFEEKLGYIELANEIVHLSTAQFTHVSGTLKLAELALVNYCHHVKNWVVKNITKPLVDSAIAGALVLYPQIGMHEMSGSVDIESLYPTGIRSINMSPETLMGQFVEKQKATIEIAANSDVMLTLVVEDSYLGPSDLKLTKTAKQWRAFLISKKWAVSGYGTVFDQTTEGFIPALLTDWFARRKQYKKLKSDNQKQCDVIVKRYRTNPDQQIEQIIQLFNSEDRIEYDKFNQLVGYYDRLQYVYKIKLNSLYGALTNLYFRFYDLRLGESTTGTGRMILTHQCRTINDILSNNYNVDFPLYETVDDAIEAGYTQSEADQIALYGSKFKGQYQGESVIYGDTDSCYFKTGAKDIDSAIAIADQVAEKVNRTYPELMRNTFLCNPGYDSLVKANREVVTDRGIFVEKKRYILHLVDLDGKRVDKLKIMGLDTKKTTLPKIISDKINSFIERLLKGESWPQVSQSIVEYKQYLEATDDIQLIGLPKGINKIEEYTSRYKVDKNTRLPGHVAAAIHYNLSLEKFNDKDSPAITSGSKIRVYYLKNLNASKKVKQFKSIALPVDSEGIPSWFAENFVIDRAAHVEKLIDNPLGNIIKAINQPVPSKQSLLVDSLVEF